MRPQRLYFVKRGPCPNWNRVPWYPYILCSRQHTACWEAMGSDNHCWVWERSTASDDGAGFLLTRWNGLDIDYAPVVRDIVLPDGTHSAYSHPGRNEEPWCLLDGAVWWSDHELPEWLRRRGVIEAPDEFTRVKILHDSGACRLSWSAQDRLRKQRGQPTAKYCSVVVTRDEPDADAT